MTTMIWVLPLLGAIGLLVVPRVNDASARLVGIAVAAADLVLVAARWVAFEPGGGVQGRLQAPWIPALGVGYHVGVDGLSLPLVAMTAGLFLAALIASWRVTERLRTYVALFLFLEAASLGVFLALDLILFLVFFDLSLVAMYFVIAGWGHEGRERAALKFFLYTFLGSLALLLGFIGLALAAPEPTFDMLALIQEPPVLRTGGGLLLLILGLGFAIKTPVVPFHTWLPPAHVGASAPGSAVLAGVQLKMGTYGFLRIAMTMLPEEWRRYGVWIAVLGVVSVLYGALVALAQPSFKRMVAYTSVNHMGYVLLAAGAAGVVGGTDVATRALALSGAATQMVSHGLITGALFLLTGVVWERAGTYDFDRLGGLAGRMPIFATLTGISAFASLGLPGFSGFIAEFQVFLGSLGSVPVPTAIAFLGVLITAGLFLLALQRLLLGSFDGTEDELRPRMTDMAPHELAAIVPLVVLFTAIGLYPRLVLDVIEPTAQVIAGLVAGS